MIKPTPNPPAADDTTPYEFPGSKRFHDAAERALDHYLKPNALTLRFHKPSTMFQVAPDQDNESLLVHACESLAQASLMTSDIAAYIELPQRRTILAIQQIIMLAELAVNRALDNHEISPPPLTTEKPLTLALSQRERGLTEVFGRDTPTCNTEPNLSFKA